MYAVIMAGGGGTRLWPLSRGTRPKPFLPLLDGGRTLLEATVARLSPLVAPGDVYVVTESRYAPLVRECVPAVPAGNILAEPTGRNTAAAVALAAHGIERDLAEVMIVLPADQAIDDASGLRAALAAAAARAGSGDLVTLGVEPSGPETGYGYVVAEGEPLALGGAASYRVARFVEKPTPERAAGLLAAGGAFWNAGTFVWRRGSLIAALERYAPDISGAVAGWVARARAEALTGEPLGLDHLERPWPGSAIAETYAALRATSIDYALLEPASLEQRVAVVPMAVGWSDLGSWSALRDLHRRPEGGAITAHAGPGAEVMDVGSRAVLVHATGGRLVVVVGLADAVVVDTPDAVLVTAADAAQDVRAVVERLRAEGRTELL